MTHSEYYIELTKRFYFEADESLINEIIERQMIPQKLSFNKFYHLYQALHLEKHGEYLQIEIKQD